jgi:DNA-directed RNA polymerase subunit omega
MKLYAMKDLLQGEDSRYMLVNMVAHRAREIAVDAEKDQVSLTEKPVTMALEEAAAGQLIADAEEEAE